MSGGSVCLVLTLCLCLATSHLEGVSGPSSRSLNRLVGQQPLLFGRRGINPNMNSLFFGKRAPAVHPSLEDLRMACGVLISSYEQVMMGSDNDS